MKSKISLYTVIGILIFILVATVCPDCAERGSREELEWQKSKKIAEGMSEEEAYEAAKKEIEKEELDAEIFEDSGDEYLNGDEDDEDWEEQEKESIEKEQTAAEAELEEGFEEEEKLLPKEPTTYCGIIWDSIDISLVIDFKTQQVSGFLVEEGNHYTDAKIVGTIDIETFKVNSTFSGIMGYYDEEVLYSGTIDGAVSENLKTFNGTLLDNQGNGVDLTATK